MRLYLFKKEIDKGRNCIDREVDFRFGKLGVNAYNKAWRLSEVRGQRSEVRGFHSPNEAKTINSIR